MGFEGVIQPFADAVKLLLKTGVQPRAKEASFFSVVAAFLSLTFSLPL